MKPVLLILCLIGFAACKNNSDPKTNKHNTSNELTMDGVWKLTSYYNYKNNLVIDTIKASDDYNQIKIYTKSKVMWSRYKEADSVDWFGYGNYFITKDSLTEILDFGSKSMNKAIQEQKKFVFELKLNKDTFSQVQIDEEGSPIYAENYERIE